MRRVGRRPRPGLAGPAALAALASAALYMVAAIRTHGLGFPLDDAWIHQTYARNLVERGEWAFLQGMPSAGSTAPLWTLVLSIGYLLRLPPVGFGYAVGVGLLGLTAWLTGRWVQALAPARANWAWAVCLIIGLEWHLAWASLSGMEILAVSIVALSTLIALERPATPYFVIGLLIGSGTWLRPESLGLLILPVGFLLLVRRDGLVAGLTRLAAGAVLAVGPYLLWQRSLGGEWWPNTAFAKQEEYASLRAIPLAVRLAAQAGVPGTWLGADGLDPGGPLVGVLVVLLPGLALFVLDQVRHRRWDRLLGFGWTFIHLGGYALRLPATYQHGRYAMPVLPIWIGLAAVGMLGAVRRSSGRLGTRVLSQAWLLLVPIVAGYFWMAGAGAYARDVAIIETEMVGTARWIERHTPEASLVAAHDIGALGYFGERELLDLAGLVEPEVIPILRDQPALARYLTERRADYLVTFPGWYPQLTTGRTPIYVSDGRFSPAAGGENMAVYRWEATAVAPCSGCAILAAPWQGRP